MRGIPRSKLLTCLDVLTPFHSGLQSLQPVLATLGSSGPSLLVLQAVSTPFPPPPPLHDDDDTSQASPNPMWWEVSRAFSRPTPLFLWLLPGSLFAGGLLQWEGSTPGLDFRAFIWPGVL